MAKDTETSDSLPIGAALDFYLDEQRTRNNSERTRKLYQTAVSRMADWFAANDGPTTVGAVETQDVRKYLIDLAGQVADSTTALHYRHLRAFFKWLETEGDIEHSPMARIKEPKVEQRPPAVITPEGLEALFDACSGNGFAQRRDLALIMTLADSGCRVSELVGMDLDDFNRDYRVIEVHGKGNRVRAVALGDNSMSALNRYMRVRATQSAATSPSLWIGKYGPLTTSGVAQILNRRAKQAGIDHIHPHQFRHTFAHEWLKAGGQEHDLMMLAGWSSPAMIQRYGKSAAAERAREAHQRLSPVDRIGRKR